MLLRTTPSHPEYRRLINLLDAELTIMDGDMHDFYDQYNGSEDIPHVVLLFSSETDEHALACGALKPYDDRRMEVKRMYVDEAARGRGLAGRVLQELETWAAELGYRSAILETGKVQRAALRLYERAGYERMGDNYGQYRGVENSVCMEKEL